MKQLLENQFARMYDSSRKVHTVHEEILEGDVALYDEHACRGCIPFFSNACEHETFKLHTESAVTFLAIEAFFNGFQHLKGERCDAMLLDDHKVVLLDMYCGMSEYMDPHWVDGKEAVGKNMKVRQQIEATLQRLYAVPEIAAHLDGLPERIGIFGYRAKDAGLFQNVPRTVSRAMDMFLAIRRNQQARRLAMPMSHGFRYVMLAYPDTYNW